MVDDKHKGTSFWERLQPRERVLVMILVAVFFFMTTAVMMFLRYKKLADIDAEIADLRGGLDLTRTYGSAYREKLNDKSQRKDDLPNEALAFSTLVEEAQTIAEVKASNQSEEPAVEVAPGLRKQTYQFDLRNVTLTQLTNFLTTVEGKEGVTVVTEALTIRSPSANEDRLNVNVVLASWYRSNGEASAEEQP